MVVVCIFTYRVYVHGFVSWGCGNRVGNEYSIVGFWVVGFDTAGYVMHSCNCSLEIGFCIC